MELKDLLQHLTTPQNRREYERAWGEFMERYGSFIERKVRQRVYTYRASRLPLQAGSVVDDAIMDVYTLLCQDNAQALANFRNPDNEFMFLSWLGIICRNATGRLLRKYFSREFLEETEGVIPPELQQSIDARAEFAEIYEEVVAQLRVSRPKSSERDIHIFLLYTFSEFDREHIEALPYLGDIGHRVVDNVVNRRRKILRELQGSGQLSLLNE
ncbi:MAG TPA: hypothetical protein PKV71_06180 [Calditrichia bacterium]|nr:hypothetical protein [Calditrichota bacterium]HQV31442.1 hypothetical protein [Calditrichia bacterium]